MKRKLILAAASLMLSFAPSAFAQHRADRQNLTDENSFSMILLGDPQGYVKYDINQPIFELCTAWIADNVDHLNITAVLCTGDLVEQNDNNALNRNMLNQTSTQMWESVSRSFERIDNLVPYMLAAGNHDYGWRSAENGQTNYPKYFPVERNRMWKETLVSEFPNREGKASLENSAHVISDENWGKFLIITAEFAPRDEVLEWAGKLTTNEKYKDHTKIFITHSLLRERTAAYTNNEKYKIRPANWGQQVWDKLLSQYDFDLAICGHTGKPGEFEDSTAYRKDKNVNGHEVHQMMFNVQISGGGWEGNGGDGWLRIMEFMPDGKTIKIKTYSPLFGISPTTKHLAHRTGAHDQFDIVIK